MVSLNNKRWIFSLALCVGVAAVVWGRAGGGDGYGGGVSGGGGGGAFGGGGESFGGSGLDTDLWVILFHLIIRHPLIGIPLLIVFYFVVVRGHSFIQDRRMLSTIVRGIQRQNKDRLGQVFDQFRGRDPGFDPVKLQDRIRMAFLKSQEAWTQQNLEPVRPFVSDGMFEQWHIQFLAHQRRGLKNIVSDLRVMGADIVGAEQTPLFDVVHAKINAVGVDQWVSLKTGEVVDGKEDPVPFCEYWTFLRRPGVRSLANGGLIEGQCPNCGAGLALNDKANCSACGSLVASAEYDWTLVKITQEEEWRFREHKREVPGVAAYLASDPGFNVSFMEDRVSAVFWRYQQALLEGNADPLRKVALPSFCETVQLPHPGLRPTFSQEEKVSRSLSTSGVGYGDVAVGVTEITSVQFGDPHDRITALVKWAGVPLNSDSGPRGRYTGKTFYSHVFAFVRKRGVQTSLARGLLSLHCPGCGAPERASHHAVCSYCGIPLGGGDHDWVLESVSPVAMADFGGEKGNTHGGINADVLDPIGLLSCLIVASMADGKIDPAEQTVLETFSQKRRIPKERVGELLRAHQAGVLRLPAPETLVESARWLDDLVEMCFMDGGVSDTERHVLIALGKTMGHSAADVDLRVRRKKTELYKEARAALRVPEHVDPYV
jgi:hypothetical protein